MIRRQNIRHKLRRSDYDPRMYLLRLPPTIAGVVLGPLESGNHLAMMMEGANIHVIAILD